MGCGMGSIKYLLFIFNFIFALGGLAILVVGVIVHLQINNYTEVVDLKVSFPSITLIVIGSIIFVIAFFGCCGAIRESQCMIITFASCLLTILIIQVAVAVYALLVLKNADMHDLKESYVKIFDKYYLVEGNQQAVDVIQSSLHCCGVEAPEDYYRLNNTSPNLPWSCCYGRTENQSCQLPEHEVYREGCATAIKSALNYAGVVLGGIALGIGAVELVGIIFALCLANSIKHLERRGYRV